MLKTTFIFKFLEKVHLHNVSSCFQLQYSEIVSEDVQPSWVILRLKATDADEYGSLHYELTGDNSEHFFLEPNSGKIKWSGDCKLLFFASSQCIIHVCSVSIQKYTFRF